MPTIELRDGQSAVLRERLNHRQDKRVKMAFFAGNRAGAVARASGQAVAEPDTTLADGTVERGFRYSGNEAELVEAQEVLLREFLVAWTVRDTDGNLIPADAADPVGDLPEDIFDILVNEAMSLYRGKPEATPAGGQAAPDPTPPSSDGSPSG